MKVKYSKEFKALDKLLYANGMVFFQSKLNDKMAIQPLVVHANYASGFEAKKAMLVSRNMWYYYEEQHVGNA